MAADVEAALADAARRGTPRQVRAACALVRSTPGGDVDRRFGLGDVTPLHVAAWRGDARVVRALCDAGASLTARDGESGWSPLHRAFHHGNVRAAAALLARGASLHTPLDRLGRSPLDILTRALRRRFDDDALDRSRSHRPTDRSPTRAAASAAFAASASHESSSSRPCDLYSWGSGVNFQLGTGSTGEQPTPRRVDDVAVAVPTAGGSAGGADVPDDDRYDRYGGSGNGEPCGGVSCAAAGKFHTVCATADGAVYVWGHGRGGRLGVNVKAVYAGDEAVLAPARLAEFGVNTRFGGKSFGLRVVAVAAGKHHTLAATECGLAFSWGLSRDGCLGYLLGAEEEASAVSSSTRAVSSSTRAVSSSTRAVSSISGDERFSPTPRRIAGTLKGIRIVAVSAANRHSVVLTAAGDVYAFGSNARGQLGVALGSALDHSHSPKRVDLTGARSIADGGGRRCVGVACAKAHTVALTADGDAFQWGHGVPGGPRRVDVGSGLVHRDGGGSPGRGFVVHQGVTSRATPGRLVAVAAGATASLALTADGAVLAWRSDDKALRCSHVRGIPDQVVSVAAGKCRCAAVTASGDVYSWDVATEGSNEAAPFRVAGIKRVVSVCVGEKHSLALQRIARPPRETIPTLDDEDDDRYDDRYAAAGNSDDVDEVTASLEAMYSNAADDDWDAELNSEPNSEVCDSDSDDDGDGRRRARLRRRRCPSLKDLCVVQIAERVCDVRNATDLASFAAHLDAPSLRAYALRVAAANLDAALCEVGPEALVECDAFTTSALERCLKGRRGDGWSTFTGNRDAARGDANDDADDADADDRYDRYDGYDDSDDDERVFRERRDAAEFLARIRAASASDRADDCEPIESAAAATNKPRRGGRGRASNDDAGPAAPTPPDEASTAGRSGDASGPSWLSARVRGIGKTPMHREDPPPKPAQTRGAGTSRRSAEAAASRAARGALSLFLSGALEEGLRRGGGASNVDAAAAETAAERRTTPRTWNPAETVTTVTNISPADDDHDVNNIPNTPSTPVPVDRRRGLLDIQLAQERETAAEREKARGFAAAASRSVPAYGRNGRNNDPHAPSVSFSLGALIGAGPRSGYGGRGSAFVKSPQSPQSPVTSIPAAWGGVRSSSIESSRSRGDASHGSPPPPSLLDIQREEEARRTSRGEFATASASPPYQNAFGSPSPNFRQTFGGSSPASARSWYVPDSGRGVAVGLRALLAEEEDARLAAELAAAEAERAKVKVPRLDEEENAEKSKSRRSRAAKPGGRNQRRPTDGSKGGTKGDGEDEAGDDGEDEAGRHLRRAAAKKKAKASSSDESSAAGTGAVNGRRRGRVGGERSVGARMSGPAKAGPSPAGDATGNGTKPRESEPPQRGNGRGGRSRRRAPRQP